MKLSVNVEQWKINGSFTISRGSKTVANVVIVQITDGEFSGYGECVPYARYGETTDSVTAQIKSIESKIENGITQEELSTLLPAGSARNAVDCAIWDFQCKQSNQSIWQHLSLPKAKAINTAYTLSLDTPYNMGIAAEENAFRPLLKLKLAGYQDIERVEAVRKNAPTSQIIVDANEGWTIKQYLDFVPKLLNLNISMIEQPFPVNQDSILFDLDRPILICADESCHDCSSFEYIIGRYDMINIKLDKAGGLTEAFKLFNLAKKNNLKTMVGCMVGTSLAMAPAFVIAQNTDIVDLDGPLLLSKDRDFGFIFKGSSMQPPLPELWG